MAAAFTAAGFEAWDLTVYDLLQGAVTLAEVDGLAFVGGFSYGDALGSGECTRGCLGRDGMGPSIRR